LAPSERRLFRQRGEAVIGAAVTLPMAARFSPQHGPRHVDDDPAKSVHATEYTVVGRLPPRHNVWDTAILVPVEDVWTLHGLPDGHADSREGIGPPWNPARLPGVPAIAVKPESVAAAYALRGQLRTPRSVALFPAEVLNDLYVVLGNVRDLMSALALITQVLVVAAVLMALLVGILARRREFAVLRAIGASRAYVFCVVWVEVALLIVGGAALGVLTGFGAAAALSAWLRAQTGFALPVSLGAPEALLVGGLVLAGAVVATLPAWLAFRRPIADGLSA
jgi:putative ABC transport system permease protein